MQNIKFGLYAKVLSLAVLLKFMACFMVLLNKSNHFLNSLGMLQIMLRFDVFMLKYSQYVLPPFDVKTKTMLRPCLDCIVILAQDVHVFIDSINIHLRNIYPNFDFSVPHFIKELPMLIFLDLHFVKTAIWIIQIDVLTGIQRSFSRL